MRRIALVGALALGLGLLGGCWFTELFVKNPTTGTSKIEDVASKVAPALPGPLGGIVAGGATLLTLIGGFFAGRAKSAAYAEGGVKGEAAAASLNPLVKVLAERKWLFPIMAGLLDGAALAGVPMDAGILALLNGALVTPAVGEFVKDGKLATVK